MLQKLLDLLQQGGVLTPAILAKQLETDPALVEAMLEDLTRRGLLREGCVGGAPTCNGCASAESCRPSPTRIWE